MNFSDEDLDAAIDIYLGGPSPGADRNHLRPQFRAVAEALSTRTKDGVRHEWRVSGFPGQQYGPYNFVWPRPGNTEDGEAAARAFIALVTDEHHVPWKEGPFLDHRTVTTTPWIEEELA